MASIRKRLLAHLLFLLAVSWVAITVATYFEARHEVEELFDAQLAQTAGVIQRLTMDEMKEEIRGERHGGRRTFGHKYEQHVSFQVWQNNRLLLRSATAPLSPLSDRLGFGDRTIDGTKWRVYGLHDNEVSALRIYTAEEYKIRNELIFQITLNTLLVFLAGIPLLALLTWWGIGRGLKPLRQVADQVASRTPEQLDPVETASIPEEISPLILSLNDLLSRLKAAFQRQRRFTADAAHELRTPLAGIKTSAQVALRAKDPSEQKRALEQVVEGVRRSAHLLEQMLTISRLVPEVISKEFKEVDLLKAAGAAVADWGPEAVSRNIDLSLSGPSDRSESFIIRGYEPGLLILLRNLIDNAVRYSEPGGRVEVTLERKQGKIELAVTDNGPGIPPEERSRVLDGYYRRAGQESYGCGLGLSIVHHIALIHHAELKLLDAPSGRGLQALVRFTE